MLIYLKGAANQNHFWIDVLNAWCSFVKCHVPASQIDALKNVLWHNQNIMVGNKHINYKHWAKKGVNFVCDIFDSQGVALSLVWHFKGNSGSELIFYSTEAWSMQSNTPSVMYCMEKPQKLLALFYRLILRLC